MFATKDEEGREEAIGEKREQTTTGGVFCRVFRYKVKNINYS